MEDSRDIRVEKIAAILREGHLQTADGMAGALGVNVRTVYRYVRHLKRIGLPIRGERGVGYMLSPEKAEAARHG